MRQPFAREAQASEAAQAAIEAKGAQRRTCSAVSKSSQYKQQKQRIHNELERPRTHRKRT
eukprot:10677727-Lingulodinium_polyedra.AAC.1